MSQLRPSQTGVFARLRAAACCIVAGCIVLPVLPMLFPAHAAADEAAPEPRKLPMRFNWVACAPDCRGWIDAVGIVTGDTVRDFEAFAGTRDFSGATVVLDSSGGSVNDAIALGRRWRQLGLKTTVGTTVERPSSAGVLQPAVMPQASCESMCVFLLLSGTTRYVPAEAEVRVHQIWMGDRADDPKAASYSANDLMIVERDIGRLAKFTFDMGGTGDLLSLSLNVPPWDDLHRLTEQELTLSNLVTTHAMTDVLQAPQPDAPAGALVAKAVQDRFSGAAQHAQTVADSQGATAKAAAAAQALNATRTAEAEGEAPATPAAK